MMNFEEFKQTVAEDIKDYLPETLKEADVQLTKVLKNNDTELDAIVIKSEDVNIAPTIYLNNFFEDYQKGESIESIMSNIAKIHVENTPAQDFDVTQITDFEKIKDKIMPRLVNEEGNSERLANIPYETKEDLAVIYAIELSSSELGTASVTVHNQLMEQWGISKEELHDTALNNLADHGNATLTDMRSVIADLLSQDMMQMGMSKEDAIKYVDAMIPDDAMPMYVVTNENKMNGAAVLLDQNFMDTVADKLGGDFFVLPSSVHECICIPKMDGADFHDLEGMVHEVNTNEVRPDDRLSEHVYEYDAKEHVLMRSDKVEERRAEKSLASDKDKGHKRISIQEKLKEKKAEAALQTPKAPTRDKKMSMEMA